MRRTEQCYKLCFCAYSVDKWGQIEQFVFGKRPQMHLPAVVTQNVDYAVVLLILADLHDVTQNFCVTWFLIPAIPLFCKKFDWAILKQHSHLAFIVLLSENLYNFLLFVVGSVGQSIWQVILNFKFYMGHPFSFKYIVHWHEVTMSEEKIISA